MIFTEREYFFIAGFMRTGSTYLSTVLDEHPEIEVAKPFSPEPKFFIQNREYQPSDLVLYEKTFFKEDTRVRGEKTIFYAELEHSAATLASLFPNSKILFLLRDPIVRAVSNYFYTVRNGSGIEDYPLAEALRVASQERCKTYDISNFTTCPLRYVSKGEYIDSIRMFSDYFPSEQLVVLLYEEFAGNISRIQSVYKSLHVDPGFVPPSLGMKINSGQELTADAVRKLLPEDLLEELITHYQPYNRELEAFLGRKIEGWLDYR